MRAEKIPTWEEMQQLREEIDLHRRLEWFFETYAPVEPEKRHRFNADFSMLVRQIYQDAQAPLIKQMSAALALVPPLPLTLRDAPSNTSGKL